MRVHSRGCLLLKVKKELHSMVSYLATFEKDERLAIHPFIHLCKFTLMYIYFILWVIIEYYIILLLKPFQLWPLEEKVASE